MPHLFPRWSVVLVLACFSLNGYGASLIWQGGPVVSNAYVVMVNWSADTSAAQGLPVFYTDIVHSDYWTILEQYSLPSQPLGFGTFGGTVTLNQAGCSTGCTVNDSDVLTYFGSLIDSNDALLPPLKFDSAGNVNTVYMIHFAPTVTVTLSGGSPVPSSCIDFIAAYENYTTNAAHNHAIVPIGLVPDCNGVSQTWGSSLALANIVTDPDAFSNPAWYGGRDGNIADICADQASATVVANGNSYEVSTLWANSSNACISAERIFADDFE